MMNQVLRCLIGPIPVHVSDARQLRSVNPRSSALADIQRFELDALLHSHQRWQSHLHHQTLRHSKLSCNRRGTQLQASKRRLKQQRHIHIHVAPIPIPIPPLTLTPAATTGTGIGPATAAHSRVALAVGSEIQSGLSSKQRFQIKNGQAGRPSVSKTQTVSSSRWSMKDGSTCRGSKRSISWHFLARASSSIVLDLATLAFWAPLLGFR